MSVVQVWPEENWMCDPELSQTTIAMWGFMQISSSTLVILKLTLHTVKPNKFS